MLAIGGGLGKRDCVIAEVLQATGRGVHLGDDECHIADVIGSLLEDPDALGLVENEAEIAAYERPRIAKKMWDIITADEL